MRYISGLKVAIALEELVDLRATTEDFKYEPHTVNIRAMENRKPEFMALNPNGKIPALYDPHGPHGAPVNILLFLLPFISQAFEIYKSKFTIPTMICVR